MKPTRLPLAGTTLIEVLIALSIFGLLIVLADTILIAASRSARRAERAADVQQHGRVAIERFSRELRESRLTPLTLRINNSVLGRTAVVFKSARLPDDATVFCVDARTETDPLYHPGCYAFPDFSFAPDDHLGSYRPIWQRYIGYYLVETEDGLHDLRRLAVRLTHPDDMLPDPATLRGGETVATLVESFDVTILGVEVRTTLASRGAVEVRQGDLPVEAMRLRSIVWIRN